MKNAMVGVGGHVDMSGGMGVGVWMGGGFK